MFQIIGYSFSHSFHCLTDIFKWRK